MAIRAGGLVDVADFGTDSGWEPLTLLAGYTGTLFARRIGNRVNVRGIVNPSTNWGAANADNQICSTVPTSLQPGNAFVTICASASSTAGAYFRAASAGANINIRPSNASYTGGVYVNYDYLTD
jgi:hypothetical protein